jgi:hypothetical protein
MKWLMLQAFFMFPKHEKDLTIREVILSISMKSISMLRQSNVLQGATKERIEE